MINQDLHLNQQKIHLAVDFLTENNANALRLGLSNDTISQNKDNINVDLTGIGPRTEDSANSDFSDLNVHQHQAHTSTSLANYWTRNNTEVSIQGLNIGSEHE